MQPLEFFAGVDWSSKEHQVCVLDLEGKVCGQRGFAHCGKGLHEMIDWIVNTTGAPAEKVGVVIETPRGPVVESSLVLKSSLKTCNTSALNTFQKMLA